MFGMLRRELEGLETSVSEALFGIFLVLISSDDLAKRYCVEYLRAYLLNQDLFAHLRKHPTDEASHAALEKKLPPVPTALLPQHTTLLSMCQTVGDFLITRYGEDVVHKIVPKLGG